MNALEARAITNENKITEEFILAEMRRDCMKAIEKCCRQGGEWIWLYTHQINQALIKELQEMGYKVELQKAPTLMDKDHYQISW